MKVERKNLEEFSAWVKKTLESVPVDFMNRTIWLMHKWIDLIVKRKGQRITYWLLMFLWIYTTTFAVCSICFCFSFLYSWYRCIYRYIAAIYNFCYLLPNIYIYMFIYIDVCICILYMYIYEVCQLKKTFSRNVLSQNVYSGNILLQPFL